MLDRPRTLKLVKLAAPLAALALLAACSSSNNNKNKNNANNNSSNAPVATTATPLASPTAAASPAPVRASTASPSAGTAPVRGSSPTPGAAAGQAAGSCSGPAAGTAAAAATSTPAAGASADEKMLRAAALTLADLPKGYSLDSSEATPPSGAGETANYSLTFTCIGQGGTGLNIQALVDGLASFSDAAAATTGFKTLPDQITQQAGQDFQLTPVTNAPKIGDDTLAYKVSGSTQGITLGGYAVIWRRGRFGVALIQVGAPAVETIDDVAALAQKQDAKLQKIAGVVPAPAATVLVDVATQAAPATAAPAAATVPAAPTAVAPVQPASGGQTLCADGTYSQSTGSGTCSHHGGVASSGAPSQTCFRKINGRNVPVTC